MGKRKRRGAINRAPPRSDSTRQGPREDPLSEPRSSDRAESSATQSQASIMDVLDSSLKRLPSGHQSPHNQNHGSSHTILLRHSRHPFGRHYSRRSSSNHSDASPSHWKGAPIYDPKLPFKLESKDLLNFPYRDNRNRIFQKPERIRASSILESTLPRDVRKIECTICNKRLRKNPFISENSMSSTDLSVVAVLFCGHVYHADCLEQKTSHEDRQDPPCPWCIGHQKSK